MHRIGAPPPGKIVTLYKECYVVYVPQDFEFPECSETDLWLQLTCGQWKESSCPSSPPCIDCTPFTEDDRQSFKPPTDQPGRIRIIDGGYSITYIRKDCWIWREDSMYKTNIGSTDTFQRNPTSAKWEIEPGFAGDS